MNKNGAWRLTEHQLENIDRPLDVIKSEYAEKAAKFILSLPEEDQQTAWYIARDPSLPLALALLEGQSLALLEDQFKTNQKEEGK